MTKVKQNKYEPSLFGNIHVIAVDSEEYTMTGESIAVLSRYLNP